MADGQMSIFGADPDLRERALATPAAAPPRSAEIYTRYVAPGLVVREYRDVRKAAAFPGLFDDKAPRVKGPYVRLPHTPLLVQTQRGDRWLNVHENRALVPPLHPDTPVLVEVVDFRDCALRDEAIDYLLVGRPRLEPDAREHARAYAIASLRACRDAVEAFFAGSCPMRGYFVRPRQIRNLVPPEKRRRRKKKTP